MTKLMAIFIHFFFSEKLSKFLPKNIFYNNENIVMTSILTTFRRLKFIRKLKINLSF